MDNPIGAFTKGVHNLFADEIIPADAAQDELNFISQDGRLKLVNGRKLIGVDGAAGMIRGLFFGYKTDGTKVLYRKTSTKIQYLNVATWTDVITGLTVGAEYSFANYSSLAGAFTIISGVDGLYKINNANPGSYISLYDATKNDKGNILIDKGRLIMWNCANASKTTLKLSYIDAQDGTVYTTVTAEILGAFGVSHYVGTLVFKAGHATRNCFAIVIKGTTGAGLETFTDNKNGVLTSDKGGTGTINYATGAYDVTFNAAVSSGNVTADYQWEDSSIKGITDFTFSATRLPAEGNRITQDIGGDAILTLVLGQDGKYYSLKSQSAYVLDISADDKTFTNLVYRRDIGIPFFRAAISTAKGVVFMNTANPDKPEMTILQRNPLGDNIEPVILFPHFKFSLFNYSDCAIDTFERYIMVSCRKTGSTFNDIILLCDLAAGTVDITGYSARMFAKDSGTLYVGHPLTESVYKIYNGFDDDGRAIPNYWISRGDQYTNLHMRSMRWRFIGELLKKIRGFRFSGLIDPNQIVKVYVSYDNAGFQLIGTIRGNADYVDYSHPQVVGSNMIGEAQIGGDDIATAYPFACEIKRLKCPKFRKRTLKLVATGIGYFDVSRLMDWDILLFENRLPGRFRQKQAVSLDGALTNQ